MSPSITPKKSKKNTKPAAAEVTRPVVRPKLSSVWRLSQQAISVLWSDKKLFGGVALIYLIVSAVAIQGLNRESDISSVQSVFESGGRGWQGSFQAFFYLINSNSNAPFVEAVLIILTSLAVIWTLRHVLAGTHNLRIRDAYYKSTYCLIQLCLVALMLVVRLLPAVAGMALYGLLVQNGLTVSGPLGYVLFLPVLIIPIIISMRLLLSSIFALYIVTLPDMLPLQAVRSAAGLVAGRRFTVLRKLIFVPIIVLIGSFVVTAPFLLIAISATPIVMYVLSAFIILFVHGYLYGLYRELMA